MQAPMSVRQLASHNLVFSSLSAIVTAMRRRHRTSLGVLLSLLVAFAVIAQGASAAVMDSMMVDSGMSSSGHMPCSGCNGDNDFSASPCAVPCLAGLAVLPSVVPVRVSQTTFPIFMADVTGAGQIRAPDPNPPQR